MGRRQTSPSTSEIGGYEYTKDLSFIAGVHKYLLCYVEQKSDPWRKRSITIKPGTYSWMTSVGIIIHEDVLLELQKVNNTLKNIEVTPGVKT